MKRYIISFAVFCLLNAFMFIKTYSQETDAKLSWELYDQLSSLEYLVTQCHKETNSFIDCSSGKNGIPHSLKRSTSHGFNSIEILDGKIITTLSFNSFITKGNYSFSITPKTLGEFYNWDYEGSFCQDEAGEGGPFLCGKYVN